MNFSKLFVAAMFSLPLSIQAHAEEFTADNCLNGQDLSAEDVDISKCPPIPNDPESIILGGTEEEIYFGSWELAQTPDGETYKIDSLSDPDSNGLRTLGVGDSATKLDAINIACWSKAYYRLRHILQNPPADYIKLRNAGYSTSFFQFQTDLRNGPTGFRRLTAYYDTLVKWVSLITTDGSCVQPTTGRFQLYLKNELSRHGL